MLRYIFLSVFALLLLTGCGSNVDKLKETKECVKCDLTGADLSRAYVDGYLSGFDLTGANLTGADLTGANLTGATLTGATLTEANLTGANLTNAYLNTADLTGLDLSGA